MRYTPRKLTCPRKRDYFSRECILETLIFRGHVSFQGSSAKTSTLRVSLLNAMKCPHDQSTTSLVPKTTILKGFAHLGDSKSHGDLKRTSGPAALFKMIHAMPQLHWSWCISGTVESNHTRKAAKGHGRGPIGQHDLGVNAEPFSSVLT